jgi:hypothetical protein
MDYDIRVGLLQGVALGYIFYEPSQEFEPEDIGDDFEIHQFCLVFFFISVVVWRDQS